MANQQHFNLLKQDKDAWNKWRKYSPQVRPYLREVDLRGIELRGVDLSGADLSGANLSKADLSGANLSGANLKGTTINIADLGRVDLRGADLSGASLLRTNLNGTDLSRANLRGASLKGVGLRGASLKGADLSGANLWRANLGDADLSDANLSDASLEQATLVRTNFTRANLTHCRVYGISAWDVHLQEAIQQDLVITPDTQPTITVDNLKVAQFIYLLLNNQEIREVIDTITSKVVLILGRFTNERKKVLDALREALRQQNYTPVLFDFDRAENRDFTETASTLAHLARFILADITEPSSIGHELQTIVPDLEVPVQPLLEEGNQAYALFPDLGKHSWVLPLHRYTDQSSLIASLADAIIKPADKKARELAVEKAKRLKQP